MSVSAVCIHTVTL